jgi:hypothetical protein
MRAASSMRMSSFLLGVGLLVGAFLTGGCICVSLCSEQLRDGVFG